MAKSICPLADWLQLSSLMIALIGKNWMDQSCWMNQFALASALVEVQDSVGIECLLPRFRSLPTCHRKSRSQLELHIEEGNQRVSQCLSGKWPGAVGEMTYILGFPIHALGLSDPTEEMVFVQNCICHRGPAPSQRQSLCRCSGAAVASRGSDTLYSVKLHEIMEQELNDNKNSKDEPARRDRIRTWPPSL